MNQLHRYFDTVAGWVEELYHHARGHTLVFVCAFDSVGRWQEFDGWARAIYKGKDGSLCVDDLNGEEHVFKYGDIVHFTIGD